MRSVKMIAWMLALALLLTVSVAASQTEEVWCAAETDSQSVYVSLCANTTVSDGLITVTYDVSKLTYADVEVDEQYVAMYAVNAEDPGVVKISWVAPGDYGLDGMVHCLLRVVFSGTDSASATVTGVVHTPKYTAISITSLETAALETAVSQAKNLDPDHYTADSFASVKAALAEAEAVLADALATQEEVDAAAKKLGDAVAALAPVETEAPTQAPTDAPTEEPTAGTTIPGSGPSGTGDDFPVGILVVVMVLCVAGIGALIIFGKKKGE